MPKYKVLLGCYRYETNRMRVEADTPEEAMAQALMEDDGEYEAHDLGESWIEEVEDENGVPIPVPEQRKEPAHYVFNATERDMIIAALRLMQREIEYGVVGEDIEAIATNHGDHPPLTVEQIDALCERINT